MRHHALDERHALAKTLRRAGADAPTLCGEWSTAQLAAHLVLRERSLVELGGRLPVKRLHQAAERLISRVASEQPYERLVELVDRGPTWRDVRWPLPTAPAWSAPVVREAANLTEYLIHHEDVRRAAADWTPRALPVDVQMAVWKRLPFTARIAMRKVSVPVELDWPSHGSVPAGARQTHSAAVRVTGDPVELVLFASGRLAQAQVEFTGEPDDVALVQGARIGL